jgi:hypothetical protein
MSTDPEEDVKLPRDAAYWASEVSTLRVSRVPTGAINLNVEGRQVVGPLQGFGQLWERTYRVRLPGVTLTPAEIMEIWKANFPSFTPPNQRFYPVMGKLEPGQLVLINGSAGMLVSTGVMVLYADDESFTLMTPQGHPESGWNTFSVYRAEDDCIVCQIQSLARANDPLYELGFRLMGSGVQEKIWVYTLTKLAEHFHVNGVVQTYKTCLDPRLQWSQVRNIWQNAAIRTMLYMLSAPLRLLFPAKLLRRVPPDTVLVVRQERREVDVITSSSDGDESASETTAPPVEKDEPKEV